MPDPIKHVVVLMMENHSFDQLLGCMKQVNPKVEGVDPNALRSNVDYPETNPPIYQNVTQSMSIVHDPYHEYVNVLHQIGGGCAGFVSDFAHFCPQSSAIERAEIMGYYALGALPVIHTLAQNFTICDHWFSSLPGPTWPNRYFIHSGTCKGHVKIPSGLYIQNEHCYDENTIYDELERSKMTWNIYHHGICHTMTLEHLWDKFEHFHRIEKFYKDPERPEKEFPQYVFLEPSYGGTDENDQHPPTDMRKGELLIAQVYNALRSNETLWNSTLFILLYDEHGGFYDHVLPPKAIPPDNCLSEYSFDQYGVRVPAVLVSPYVPKGGLVDTAFDHTSLLRFLIEKWGFNINSLGKRTSDPSTQTFASVLLNAPRTDAPAPFDISKLPTCDEVVPAKINDHQAALVSFGHFLEQKMAHVEELAAVGYRALKSLDGPLAQLAVAKDRFLLFLHHGQKGRLDPT